MSTTTDVSYEPSIETIAKKAGELLQTHHYTLAPRKDGSECCIAFYLPEEGGYAYSRYNTENNYEWRFLTTPSFEDEFSIIEMVDIEHYESALHQLATLVVQGRRGMKQMLTMMGKKTRRRVGSKMLKYIENTI